MDFTKVLVLLAFSGLALAQENDMPPMVKSYLDAMHHSLCDKLDGMFAHRKSAEMFCQGNHEQQYQFTAGKSAGQTIGLEDIAPALLEHHSPFREAIKGICTDKDINSIKSVSSSSMLSRFMANAVLTEKCGSYFREGIRYWNYNAGHAYQQFQKNAPKDGSAEDL